MPRADDNIPGYDSIPWNGRYANFFMASVIDRTRSYAVKLFNHRNSITNIAYKDDPTIAWCDLTDDNSLFAAWSNGFLHPNSNFSSRIALDAVWTIICSINIKQRQHYQKHGKLFREAIRN